ncbi:hypothetical protein RugamoR57_04300 [Duganella caerulea]|uniref:hypothetical protein n=1 Tax=Duganella caerulea TaxID=2885762 RepID=UPI0030E953C1
MTDIVEDVDPRVDGAAAQRGGTRYIACARHKDEATVEAHKQMGFQDGWGKALDQLIAHMKQQ